MINSREGKVIMTYDENPKLAEAQIYSDLACIFDAIIREFGSDVLIKYLSTYAKMKIIDKENKK